MYFVKIISYSSTHFYVINLKIDLHFSMFLCFDYDFFIKIGVVVSIITKLVLNLLFFLVYVQSVFEEILSDPLCMNCHQFTSDPLTFMFLY
jgi:hypothetical protein